MYDSLRKDLHFEISFINWPKYGGEKTYAEIAKRVIEENCIKDDDIVGGSSLGGMIAMEIARQKKQRAVVLIGSATNKAEVQIILSILAPIAAITPISLLQLLIGKHDNIIAQMFAETDPEFIRAMCRYLPEWSGAIISKTPLFRIHGQKDHVIPCPKKGAEIIANAGHLIAITHAKECGQFIGKINQQLTGGSI